MSIKYNKDTGEFYSELTNRNVGWVHESGYLYIHYKGRDWLAHRLAFLLMGEEVPIEVDHIDRNKLNNRWSNLRKATRQLNCTNQSIRKDNTTGIKGLSFDKRNKLKPWIYRKQTSGVTKQKSFASYEEALNYIKGNNNGF